MRSTRLRPSVVPESFARELRGLAGFRNILVHGYLEVELSRVHHLLNQRLDDFDRFARCVTDWHTRADTQS